MGIDNRLHDSAMTWGADYFGIADLSPAHDTNQDQGGTEIIVTRESRSYL